MLIHITEKCSMGCPHCMDDARADGKHMSFEVFEKAVDFVIRNDIYHGLIITGGEPTEHPEFLMFMNYLIVSLAKKNLQSIIAVTTNGMWLLEDSENVNAAKALIRSSRDVQLSFQVSTDTRYYPKKLDTTKRLWREPGFVLCTDCVEAIYPQGRALSNKIPYKAIGSKCFNVRALSKQLPAPTLNSIVMELGRRGKFCTPAIRVDGSIGLGESRLCPACAGIDDTEQDVIRKIQEFKCDGCKFLNDTLPPLYRRFVE